MHSRALPPGGLLLERGAGPLAALLVAGCASGPPPLRPMTPAETEEGRVDPEVRALLAGLGRPPGRGAAASDAGSAGSDRSRWAALQPFTAQVQEVARVEDLQVPGPAGQIRLRVFRPAAGGEPAPVVVFLHGGEYTAGSIGLYDSTCRALALGARAVVVAVEYRLAPEASFPAASDDAGAAVRWVLAHAAGLRIDPRRVALAGDDVGAALAVVEAVELARRGQGTHAPLRALALAYPVLDARLESASWREFGALPYLLTRDEFGRALALYLGSAPRSEPRASPVLFGASELARLPRTLLLTAELDPARDDAAHLASALRAAGVPAELRQSPGMVHGFLLLAGAVEPAARALEGVATFLRGALATPAP